MELQTRMRDLLHCVAMVTICLVTKAPTPLWSIHFSSSQSCLQSAPISITTAEQTYVPVTRQYLDPINSEVERFGTMAITLKEQARQSGLVLLDETPEWYFEDWPSLEGEWRYRHASVVLNHPENNQEQTVVVLGGYRSGQGELDSILVLNLAESNKQWREGPRINQKRDGHAAVVCNGGIYVMGGDNGAPLDCIERIDVKDLLPSSLTSSSTRASHWTTFNCRLSTPRWGCGAVAVHNRYIVVMGGHNNDGYLSSVDIIDTNNHTVTAGPSMTVPRQFCASAVIGHRIFVVGGRNDDDYLDSTEYLDYATPCDSDETQKETGSTFISSSHTWTAHSELRLSELQGSCATVAVGSCLVVAGRQGHLTVKVLDTHHNRVWNLPPFTNNREGCSLVTLANQVAVIGGWSNSTSATFPLMDRNSWCFRRLCEQRPNGWYQFRDRIHIRHVHISSFSTSPLAHKRARPDTRRGDEDKDET